MAKDREQTRSITGIAEPNSARRGAGKDSSRVSPPPRRNRGRAVPQERGTPTRKGVPPKQKPVAGLILVVVAVLALGGWGIARWAKLHRATRHLSTPTVGGIPLSPEEVALQRAAEQKPHDPAPWQKLSELYLEQQQPFEAVWVLQEALERGPGDARSMLRLAEALQTAELYRPAIATLSDLLQRQPENQEARLHLVRLHLRLGEARPAIAVLRGAGNRLSSWSEGLLELGRARQLDGDLAGAIAAYRQHLAVSPQSADGAVRLARALLEHGELDPARRALEHHRLSAPRDPRFPFYLGMSWIQDGHPQKPERAMEMFKEAFVVAPHHPLPHYYMGLLLARQGRWPEAQVHFLKATQADPRDPDPQLWFARSLEKTGDLAQAKEQLGVYAFIRDDAYQAAQTFKEMVKADPKNVQAPRLVSLAYLRLGRNDWAIRETKAALQQHPRDVTLLERLATLYIMTHSRPAARTVCQEWLKIQPGAARAHWLLGRVAQDDLKVSEAIREYEIAAADPSDPEYLAALAGALNDASGTASLRRAAGLLQTAVQRSPKSEKYRHDLGMTLQQLGDLEGARRQFLAALDLNPRHGPSFSGISQLCVRLHKTALARFFAPLVRAAQDQSREELRLSRRIAQNPTSAEAHYAMAGFLIHSASFTTARAHLERALELRPSSPEAAAALARVKRAISVR